MPDECLDHYSTDTTKALDGIFAAREVVEVRSIRTGKGRPLTWQAVKAENLKARWLSFHLSATHRESMIFCVFAETQWPLPLPANLVTGETEVRHGCGCYLRHLPLGYQSNLCFEDFGKWLPLPSDACDDSWDTCCLARPSPVGGRHLPK